MGELNAEMLRDMDFRDVGFWTLHDVAHRLRYQVDETHSGYLDVSNVLYAFVQNDDVLYIGKTTRSVRNRFNGYCNPGSTQSTNIKCNAGIRDIISRGGEVRILIFSPISHLSYSEFPINLAAGLEDALVARIAPIWNGKGAGAVVMQTETAELEEDALTDDLSEDAVDPKALYAFDFVLRHYYYKSGIVNVGTQASPYFGVDGDPVRISFSDGTTDITSSINRTANRSGGVRLVGKNRLIGDWFREHFNEGETVQVRILGPNWIMFMR
ncbi:MAG: GIY-YIG nuclease family protein [Asticcacaulis sp.]